MVGDTEAAVAAGMALLDSAGDIPTEEAIAASLAGSSRRTVVLTVLPSEGCVEAAKQALSRFGAVGAGVIALLPPAGWEHAPQLMELQESGLAVGLHCEGLDEAVTALQTVQQTAGALRPAVLQVCYSPCADAQLLS